jgi:glycerophosphoryl diester phosphodiesterase
LTKDGQIVVMHDANTKRTAGKDARIVDQTTEELRALDAGRWKGERWAGEKIPMLSEVLAMIPEGKQLFIEVKCGPEILPELQRVIGVSRRKASQLVIISFNFAVVEQARKLMPEIDAYFLAGAKNDKETGAQPDLAALIAKAKGANLTGLDLDYRLPIDAQTVAHAKAAGLKIQIWTVDDTAVAKRLAGAGVQGITTNRPAFLREALK